MNSSDKILSSIKQDCDNALEAIKADSAQICGQILEKGRENAAEAKAEIDSKTARKASQIRAANASRTELEQRNALLRQRRLEIDVTCDAVYKRLISLDAEDYFNVIYKLLLKLKNSDGLVCLNDGDLKRLPADFCDRLKALGVKARLCGDPVDIDGGFILKNGDIEENMSFSSLLAANRDSVEDLINRELFAQ